MTPSPPAPVDPALGRRVLAVSSLGHFVNDGTTFFVPVIAALLGLVRGFSPIEVTVLFVVYYVSAAGFGLFVGWWADRRGRPASLMAIGVTLLGVGLVGFSVTLAGSASGYDYPLALVSGLLTGIATSFYHPLGASLIQRTTAPEKRGLALGINGAFGSFGRALYPFLFFVVGYFLVPSDGVLLFGLVGFAGASAISYGTRSVRADERRPGAATLTPSKGSALTPAILALTAVSFVRSVAMQGVAVWIPTYLTATQGVAAGSDLGLAVTVMYIGGILGQPVFGLAANSLDRRALIGLSSAGAALTTLGYLFTGGATAEILLFLVGFFTFSAFPLLMTLSSDYVPSGSSSLANAVVFGLGSGGGGTVGPLIVGAIAAGGYAALTQGFEVMVALGLVAAFLVVLLPRGGRGAPRSLFG